jgi:transcription termination/antitermination protein NusA
MAIMTTGRRCPNAALQSSQYCGLPQHQALARFATNQVAVLSPLSDEEVATLADANADGATVSAIVEKAESQFDEDAGSEEPTEAEEPAEGEAGAEPEGDAEPEADGTPDADGTPEAGVAPETGSEDGGEPEGASEDGGEPEAEEAVTTAEERTE